MSFSHICDVYLFIDVTVLKSLQCIDGTELGSNGRILLSGEERKHAVM